jgi:hypothetical protein
MSMFITYIQITKKESPGYKFGNKVYANIKIMVAKVK